MTVLPFDPTKGSPGGWPATWQTLPHGISTGRYTDPAFLKLEYERLWPKVWQAAARVDVIPESGDYATYEIGDQSVLLVRVDATTIKAYYNVCPHRGTSLGADCGTFDDGKIICPFHGWRWDLHGRNQFVLERHEFRNGQLRDSDVALKAIKVAVFAGFVFINFDPDCIPFDDFIAPVRHWLEDLAVSEMRHYWWKTIPIRANWKVAQEAFFEAYHVPATHPQLEPKAAEVIYGDRAEADADFTHHNIDYEVFPKGHGRFYGGKKTPMAGHIKKIVGDPVDSMAARMNLLVEGMDAQVLKEDVDIIRSLKGQPVPEGSTLGAMYVKALFATAAAQSRPMPKPLPEVIGMWGGEIFIFPNIMILPQGGNAMIYRAKPDPVDPDLCAFEIFSTKSYPAAVKPLRAVVQKVTDPLDPNQVLLIPRQDLGNIPRMQKGLHSRGIRHIFLASHHEKMILNMHQELDRFLQP